MIAIGIIGLILLSINTLMTICIYMKVDEIAEDFPRDRP
jgi:hypothetical protein